jgi:uncharacterized protein YbjQ (UPF0145 family)
VVRYEDLRRDPAAFLSRFLAFVGLERSDELIAAAISRSSFEAMRGMEEREIAGQVPGLFTEGTSYSAAQTRGRRFLMSGRSQTYHELLSGPRIEAALTRFGPAMEKLGYTAEGNGG